MCALGLHAKGYPLYKPVSLPETVPHAVHWVARSPKDTYVISRGKLITPHWCVMMGLFVWLATLNRSLRALWKQSPVLLITVITRWQWHSAWHRWVISKYFPKGSPEQIHNSLLKTVTVLKTTPRQEQLNHLTELDQDSIPVPGTKYVLNKYLLTKELGGRACWEKLKACVRPGEVRFRYEECVIGIQKRDPSWGIRRRRIYYYFYCYCLLWAELCPPHPIHMLTS